MASNKLIVKIILWIIALLLLAAVSYGSFFIYKTYSLGNKITFVPKEENGLWSTLKSFSSNDANNLRGAEKGRINILMLGIAGKGKPGQNLTDTIMIASINPKTNQVALLSIPRDLHTEIPNSNISMKINSVYQFALNNSNHQEKEASEIVKKTISSITDLPLDYYVIMNFDGFVKVIDAIGGVNITSERDIYDPRYPGPNYSYETFELKKGFHHLDGATALKYARERHNDPEGDFGRAKRQQQILQATKNKVFSAGTAINLRAVNDIFNALGDNIRTDIPPEDLESFFNLARKADTNNINNVVIDAWNKESLLKVSHIFYQDKRAFILVPRVGNWSEVQETAQEIFDLNKIKRRKEEIAKEKANVAVINKSGYSLLASRIKNLLSDNFNYKNVIALNDSSSVLEEKTIVYDLTSGTKPFTLDELIIKLPSYASYSLPEEYKKTVQNTSPDIVIVLGKDIVEKYNKEEDSIEDYRNSTDANEYSEFRNE
ncbi:MAG TPA: LCP family protein [Candidatus Moranbacteria bacterium]|nr:LCP family protein [Candidatus Moranbacteria bacterium]